MNLALAWNCNAKSSTGESPVAQFVTRRFAEILEHLQEPYSLGMAGKGVFDELVALAEQCQIEDWDGYGAAALVEESRVFAWQFLEALPLGTPAPSVGAEPDGQVTLEWHRGPRWTLSVSVSPEGDLHYAALFGFETTYGTVPFFGEAPKRISDLIRQVMAK